MRMNQILGVMLVLAAVCVGAPSAMAGGVTRNCPDGDCRNNPPPASNGGGSGRGTVVADSTAVWAGPGTNYGSPSGHLSKGESFTIICQAQGTPTSGPRAQNWPWWNKISGPASGWVSDADVDSGPNTRSARDCRPDELPGATASNASSGTGKVVDYVFTWDGPGTGFQRLGRLDKGTSFTIVCQIRGTPMDGPRAKNWSWWDKISGPASGWVSDAEIDSGPAARAARDCRPDELPSGQMCVIGDTVRRYVSVKWPLRPDYSAVRFTWTPQFCRVGGEWTTSTAPTLQILSPASLLGIRLDLEAPRQIANGVELRGGVRQCLPINVSGSVSAEGVGGSAGTGGTACDSVGDVTIKATVTNNKVDYAWTITTRPDVTPGLKLFWTDKTI